MNYNFYWTVLIRYKHVLLEGVKLTLEISVISMLVSMIMGTLIGIGKTSKYWPIRYFFSFYVEFFRNIPLVVILFFWYFGIGLDSMEASIVGLSFFTSAYIAEIIRAGIGSIPKEQIDAAKASGLTSIVIISKIIIPQAIMITIPPIVLEFLNVIKNSSMAMTIAVAELTFASQEIEALTFRGFESATGALVLYFVMTVTVSICMNYIETKMKINIKVG
jgi:His/Glu/Gln/Arg/opine family amino acid ABC transporter permease subunit